MNPAEIREVLERRGAVLTGHFLLSSGRHSDVYVQKFRVFEDPRLTQRFGEAIADDFPGEFDVVAAPAVGAIVLGFATALAVDARFVISERTEGAMTFRRGFTIRPHERVLIVEDVITTGGSVQEVIDLVKGGPGTLVGVGALIDRMDRARAMRFSAPLKALLKLEVGSWDADKCPLCERNEALIDPGSRRLNA